MNDIIFLRNHFKNLCYHEDDFGLEVKAHHFFVSSHGKNPCDGIGAAIKRKTRKTSLQRPIDNQILTAQQMFHTLNDDDSSDIK